MLKYLVSVYGVLLISTSSAEVSQSLNVSWNCGMTRSNSSNTGRVSDLFTSKLLGYDYNEKPVYAIEFGKWDFRWLADHPKELEIFEKNFDRFTEDMVNGLLFPSLENKTLETSYVAIIDFDGFSVGKFVSSKSVKVLLNFSEKLQKTVPVTSYGFYLNVNSLAEQLLQLSKPYAGNVLEIFEFYGSNSRRWIPQLLRKIPRSELPAKYGGYDGHKPRLVCYFL